MEEPSKAVVVGVDGSPASLVAVQWAADDAARLGVPLRIVCVVDRYPYQIVKFPDADLGDQLVRGAVRILADAERAARDQRPELTIITQVVEGGPTEALRRQAADATELVVGTRGMGGFTGAVVGSVSMYLAGYAPGPVVVVRRAPEASYGEIIVGLDDSPSCQPALAYAFEQAMLRGGAVRTLHAWQLPVHAFAPELHYEADEIRTAQFAVVAGLLDSWREEYPDVKVIDDVRCAHPVESLVAASRSADLLVVGSSGRCALGPALLGSISRGVLHHAECPVAVVRARI